MAMQKMRLSQLTPLAPAGPVRWTWQETCGSGLGIGTQTTPHKPKPTLADRKLVIIKSFAVVVMLTGRMVYVQPTVLKAVEIYRQPSATPTSASGVCCQ